MGVLFTAITLLLALIVSVATRGQISRIADLPFKRLSLLFLGVAIQGGLEWISLPTWYADYVGAGLLIFSYAMLLGFCASNLRIDGMLVITAGIALNALVISLNLGMPYQAPLGHAVVETAKHRPERSDDIATILSDHIVIPPLRTSISFGDLIIAVGLIETCYRGSRRQIRSRAARTLTS